MNVGHGLGESKVLEAAVFAPPFSPEAAAQLSKIAKLARDIAAKKGSNSVGEPKIGRHNIAQPTRGRGDRKSVV